MEKKSAKYIETIGRRKTSSARVRVTPATKLSVVINDKPVTTYFMTKELETIVKSPFGESSLGDKFEVTAVVKGGGIHSQAEAVRHGISRALVEMSEEERGTLKKAGFLKRDPRSKERRKFGLKKARKSPQWSKR
ncbi:MAG: 30S ribosomal protein S9 [Candidatus Pacebacteria bacterium]|nr:30S ribosomal protein S9 [Candidatus Paceibacterota bacterium]MBP9058138.1 30S ribosomal protein S9 [Candidatus Paceibacterota bacterium]MBP9770120.1 30S ribosomal protein S9 [Candidatus Paceibacterota bacterium]